MFKPRFIKKQLLKAARWQLAHPKHALTDWTNGAFYSGVFTAYQATQSKLLLDLGAYPGGEASGSGFDCYALAWGIN
jgi:rhamnogalacturonyl hydrolase YesR